MLISCWLKDVSSSLFTAVVKSLSNLFLSLFPSDIQSFMFHLLFYIQLFHSTSFVHNLSLLLLLKFTANAQLLQYCSLSFSKSLTPPLDHSLVICSEEEGEEERCREEEHTSRLTLLQHTPGSDNHNSLPRRSLRHLEACTFTGAWFITHGMLSLAPLAWLSSLRPLINPSSIPAWFSVLHAGEKCLGPKLAYPITTYKKHKICSLCLRSLHKTLISHV